MIILSADLHHMSLNTGNQQHSDITEIQTAQRFTELLEAYNVKATYFVSGRSFEEEWADLEPLCHHPLIELGGHTYNCFEPALFHRVCNKLLGSYNGPYWFQKWDVQRTQRIIRERTGKEITLWRNHMYMHGPHTEQVLRDCGITICSDGVNKNSNGLEQHESGIYNLPLNIIPDHEHLYHAERTPEWVEAWIKRYNWSDDFGSASYYIDEWCDMVLAQLQHNLEHGIVSNMILHPITMYLCDNFAAAERIIAFISKHQNQFMSELLVSKTKKEKVNV